MTVNSTPSSREQEKRNQAKDIRRMLNFGNRLYNLLEQAAKDKLKIQKRINSDTGGAP